MNVEIDNWKDLLRFCGDKLVGQGAVSNRYTDEIVEVIDKYGAYIVIDDYIAIPHAKSTHINKTAMALVILKEKVLFPRNKEVKVLLPFSSLDNKEHLKALVEFSNLITNENFKNLLSNDKIKLKDLMTLIGHKEN